MNGGGIRPSAGVVLPLLPPALLHYTINRRKLQAVRQKICAKKAEILGGVPCAAPVHPAAVENSMGGLAPALPARRASAIPGGGLARLVARLPCLYLLFCPLSPQPPSPAGKGVPQSLFRRGASPPAPLHLTACGTYRTCQAGTRRGACPVGRPPTLPLPSFLPPIPPAPFPGGEGGAPKFISPGGFAPGTPAFNRLRHLQNLPSRYPAAEIRDCRKNDRKRFPMSSAGSQGEGGPGEMELSVASDGGV